MSRRRYGASSSSSPFVQSVMSDRRESEQERAPFWSDLPTSERLPERFEGRLLAAALQRRAAHAGAISPQRVERTLF